MLKNKFLSPELTRLAIIIIASKVVINVILAQIVLGMCYANDRELDREVQRSVVNELPAK